MKTFLLLLIFLSTGLAGDVLKHWKVSYSPEPNTTSRPMYVDAPDERGAIRAFSDLLPKAIIWSVSEVH